MNYVTRTVLLAALMLGGSAANVMAQQPNRAAIEHELAITAYNYAVGCEERMKYEEALEGLTHIPAGQLTPAQQATADSLRMKCEAMVGHPMAAQEIQLRASEQMQLDDQSDAFMRGIRLYQSGSYAAAIKSFDEVIEMGIGPRPQVHIEAMFWRGQCRYQLSQWDECCQDLILFNDTKNASTDRMCDAQAYYTMGYARMQAKKWHQARLNFERYLDHETDKSAASYTDGQSRYRECKELEARNGNAQYQQPLTLTRVEPISGETIAIEDSLLRHDSQAEQERIDNNEAIRAWRNWHAPYIQE